MVEELSVIREQLFDAPVEVKQAFNDVVKYFSGKGKGKSINYQKGKGKEKPENEIRYYYVTYLDNSKKDESGRSKHIYVVYYKAPYSWDLDHNKVNEIERILKEFIEDHGTPASKAFVTLPKKESFKDHMLKDNKSDEVVENPTKGSKYGSGKQERRGSK